MMPIRSFGRPSINLRVTSRIASTRVASCPPMVKSFVSIEPETSSTSMMSIPLASIWVRLLPSCGRASAITKIASETSSSVRRIFPARAALRFPIARRLAVDEYVSAAAGPRFPRNHATNGIASSNKSSHGRANVNALFAGHQLNTVVMSSESLPLLRDGIKRSRVALLARTESLLAIATRYPRWSLRIVRT